MASWSQLPAGVEEMSCKSVAHPWTDSCLLSTVCAWLEAFVGSVEFFGLLYSCQYLSKVLKKKKMKAEVKDILWMCLRSSVFGATLCSSTIGFHCCLRNLLGRFSSLSLIFFPAVLGGHSIYMEARKSRELFANAFANCSIEVWVKFLERRKILTWNQNIQTAIFMVFSSVVSYLLSSTNFNSSYFWFFIPPTVSKVNTNDVCFHEGDCKTHISKLFLMYSTTGFLLQFLKLLLTNFKNPTFILSSLTSPRTFKLAAFLGGYVVLYQAIRCFLYQKEKKYSLSHDSLAGFLAGAAFRFQPTIPILNSAIITTAKIFTEIACQKKMLPDLPYMETLFAFFCGVLFHQRIMGGYCPRLTYYFMTGVTHGLADRICENFAQIVNSLRVVKN